MFEESSLTSAKATSQETLSQNVDLHKKRSKLVLRDLLFKFESNEVKKFIQIFLKLRLLHQELLSEVLSFLDYFQLEAILGYCTNEPGFLKTVAHAYERENQIREIATLFGATIFLSQTRKVWAVGRLDHTHPPISKPKMINQYATQITNTNGNLYVKDQSGNTYTYRKKTHHQISPNPNYEFSTFVLRSKHLLNFFIVDNLLYYSHLVDDNDGLRNTFPQIEPSLADTPIKACYSTPDEVCVLDIAGNLWIKSLSEHSKLTHYCADNTRFHKISNLPTLRDVYLSMTHIILIDQENKLWVCGSNENLQLGIPNNMTTVKHFTKVGIPGFDKYQASSVINKRDATFVLMKDGTCFACGLNQDNRLRLTHHQPQPVHQKYFCKIDMPSNVQFQKIWACIDAIYALDGEHKLWCSVIGNNRKPFEKINLPGDPQVKSVNTTEPSRTIILDTAGKAWVKGLNTCFQLGLGHNNNINSFEPLLSFFKPNPMLRKELDQISLSRTI